MTGQRIGYKRVSSSDQNTVLQLDKQTLDEVFEDKASGKDTERPQLYEAIRHSRRGDELVIHSMDRLARNLDDLRAIVNALTKGGTITVNGTTIDHKGGVRVTFLKEDLTFTGEANKYSTFMLTLLGAVAEFEREMIKERQREGIAIAKAQGKYKGGKPKLTSQQIAEIAERKQAGERVADLAREFDISRQTVYNALATI